MNKFIIASNGADSAHRNMITLFFHEKPEWGFWHHFEEFWMVNGGPEQMTAKQLWDTLVETNPTLGNVSLIVIKLPVGNQGMTYWGRSKKDGWDWMKTQGWGNAA